MQERLNDTLVVLNRDPQGSAGRTEICRGTDGQKWIRVSITQFELQKKVLLQLDQSIPVCLSEAQSEGQPEVQLETQSEEQLEPRLNLLFPFQKGQSLDEWLFYEQPTLEQRKQMCMSLLEQFLTQPIPTEIAALSVRTENLCFQHDKLVLQILPDLKSWKCELGETAVVRRVAKQMAEILTRDLKVRIDQAYPLELQLLILRSQSENYDNWGQIQKDLFRIPNTLASKTQKLQDIKNCVQKKIERWAPIGLRIVTFVLAVMAIISISFKAFEWYTNRNAPEQKNIAETNQQDSGEESK